MLFEQLSRIRILIERNKLDEVQGKIAEALSEHPDWADLYGMQAQVYERKDEYRKALESIERAIGLDPELDFHFFIKSRIHAHLKEYDKAFAAIDEALRLESEYADYYGQKALLFLRKEKKNEAIEWANKGKEKDPDNNLCTNVLSMALGSSGKSGEAEQVLGSLLEADPENEFTQANMGYNNLRKGNIQKAKEHFSAALLIDPEFEYARLGMIEATKATNFFYRKILEYNVWMEQKTAGRRWMFAIGLVIIVKLIPFLVPFYLIFLLWIWFAPPVANVVLYFDKHGRYLMSKETTLLARTNIALLGLATATAVLSPFTSWSLLVLAFAFFVAIVPIHGIDIRERKLNKIIMGVFAALFILIGASGIILSSMGKKGEMMWVFLILAMFLYTWIANFFDD